MATIYQKQLADKCIILEPKEKLHREMALPASWIKLRLAMALSLTTAGSQNASPVTESLAWSNARSALAFGLKDGSDIAPGYTGSRFIGMKQAGTNDAGYSTDNSCLWYTAAASHEKVGWLTNGALAAETSQNSLTASLSSSPQNDTYYANWMVLEIEVSGMAVYLKYGISEGSGATDVSNTAMEYQLQNMALTAFSGALTGWWEAGQAPELRHFYFRSPLLSNRVRVHNYGFLLVA